MNITLRQLRYLVALDRAGHFGRAAASCGVTQPALSMQIRELEAVLGTDLVQRGRREAALTPAGREAVARGRSILISVDDLAVAARRAARSQSGMLRFGVIPTVAPYLLPGALPLLGACFPDLALELREGQTAALVEALADNELDLLLLALPIDAPSIETMALFDDRFLLVAPAGAGDPERGSATLSGLDRDRLLLLEEGHCLRDQALAVCGLAGGAALKPLGATSLATLVQMVAAGHGITLVPETAVAVEARDPRLSVRRFRPPEPARRIGLAWRRASPRRADYRALGEALMGLAPAGEPARRGEPAAL